MMRKTGLLMVLLGCLMVQPLWSQETADIVKAYPKGKDIVMEYDLGADADFVRLFVSFDGGITYRGPLQQVTGDVADVKAGFGHSIVWDVLRELETDAFENNNVRFKLKVKLKGRWPEENFFTLNAAYAPYPQASFGFSAGQVRRFGWFVSVMSNGSFSGYGTSGSCDKDGYTSEGYLPIYSGEVSKMRLSLMAGGMMRISGSWLARVGVGYGIRTLCWEVEDGSWLRNEAFSASGLDLSAGLQLHWKGVAFSAEVVTTQFKNIEGKIGVGVVF